MPARGFFILGTDTYVGKTTLAVNLLSFLKANGYSTIGSKPIASGARQTKKGLRNSDALALQKAATIHIPYESVNPFCFIPAVAPHIAAAQQACQLSVIKVMKLCEPLLNFKADYQIIEGLGGASVPLNERETMLDLVKALGFPVILVVGLRLGCLNHAFLTYEVLKNRNIPIAACLANQIDPNMLFHEENWLTLKQCIPAPFLRFIPYADKKSLGTKLCIDWSSLISENTFH